VLLLLLLTSGDHYVVCIYDNNCCALKKYIRTNQATQMALRAAGGAGHCCWRQRPAANKAFITSVATSSMRLSIINSNLSLLNSAMRNVHSESNFSIRRNLSSGPAAASTEDAPRILITGILYTLD
jgi:hypothetical protein